MQKPFKTTVIAAAVLGALALSGCAGMSQTEKDTATGAGIGAAAGAVIGAMAGGHAAKGAAIGAAVGAAGGYIWSKNMREQQASMEEATQGTGVEVSRTTDNRLKLEIPSDVSFDVEQGEVLGIIGKNGAGKSTALKIISRITPPTTGRVELHGRVGSLLGVGTGFHGDLTGRENVYLNGTTIRLDGAVRLAPK